MKIFPHNITSQSREASERHREHRRMMQSVSFPPCSTYTLTVCVCFPADIINCVCVCEHACGPAALSQPTYILMEPKCLGLLLLHVNLSCFSPVCELCDGSLCTHRLCVCVWCLYVFKTKISNTKPGHWLSESQKTYFIAEIQSPAS